MSRTLYRPMFRRGGSAGEGITSGLRQGYSSGQGVSNPGGDSPQYYPPRKESSLNSLSFLNTPPPELPRSTAGADFWLNLGTNILAQPGGRPILQTLGTAGKEPLKQFQQQRGQEKLLEYKHGQAERQFQLEWYKALNDEDKLKVQREMEWYIEQGYSKQEALDAVMRRKPKSKEDIEREATEKEAETHAENIKRIQDKVAKEAGEDIPPHWAKHISNFYDWADENPEYKIDNTQPFIDFMEGTSGSFKYDGDENIVLGIDVVDSYMDGIAYVDPNTGKIYYKEKGNAKLVLITQDEEIISSE